jgi:hypothetical protein
VCDREIGDAYPPPPRPQAIDSTSSMFVGPCWPIISLIYNSYLHFETDHSSVFGHFIEMIAYHGPSALL